MATLACRVLLRVPRIQPSLVRIFPGVGAQRAIFISPIPQQIARESAEVPESVETLNDAPLVIENDTGQVDWSRSFHGLSMQPFSEEASKVLTAPLDINDVEIKPGIFGQASLMCRWHNISS
jgi:hypothetical protein